MFLHLVRKELLEQLLTLRFTLAGIICLVIMLTSMFVLTKDYKEALADYRTNVVMHKNEIEESGSFTWDGIKIDKPLNPMQIFFKGVDKDMTTTARVSGIQEPQFQANYERNPVTFLFPPIDLLFFIGIVMSLLAIAFSYDAIAGEKELGTLKLLMSYSLPRDQVLLAKWIGGYLALIAPFVVSLVCGLVVVSLFPNVELRPQHWTALGPILLVALLYLSAVYSMGIFVSARTQLTSTAITVLLLVWVLVVLIVPNAAPYIAAQIQPVRSFVLVEKEKRQLQHDEAERFDKIVDEWMEANPDVTRFVRNANWTRLNIGRIERLIDGQQKINDQYHKRLDQQIRLAQNLSRLSPLASFAYATTDLAATGVRDRNHFMNQLPSYRKEVSTFGQQAWIDAASREDWNSRTIEGYPRFVYAESPISDRINWIDILVLGMWNIVFFMGAYLSFLRYDVQ
jgi:ABC-type transport system involved in multi-copper enzyme maturation permease subunit